MYDLLDPFCHHLCPIKQTLGSLDLPLMVEPRGNETREPLATEAEAPKIEKYRELIGNGHIFQPVALEVPGSSSESSENFINRLWKTLCRSHDD